MPYLMLKKWISAADLTKFQILFLPLDLNFV